MKKTFACYNYRQIIYKSVQFMSSMYCLIIQYSVIIVHTQMNGITSVSYQEDMDYES